MLRPEALERRSALDHRFCQTRDCPVVYFGKDEIFERGEIGVAVFEKEPVGDRTVCYCFGIREGDIRREFFATGGSTPADRVRALIKAGRCACEVKNPAGSCCLGNMVAVAKATEDAKSAEASEGSLLEAERTHGAAPSGTRGTRVARARSGPSSSPEKVRQKTP